MTKLLCLSSQIFAKAEYENPTGSIKDRPARAILQAAKSRLQPGCTVIEPTSGNMGIALAAECRHLGCRCMIVMPDSMSPERQQRIRHYGGEVVLTPGRLGMQGAVEKAAELAQKIPDSFLARQFENSANVLAHYQGTGPEIWAQTGGKVDVFVAGVGTGGTITGTGRYLKEQNPALRVVAVEPAASPLLSLGWAGSHGIQGIGANFIPKILDVALLDEVIRVSDDDAFAAAGCLNARGIPVGISAGANVHAARILADRFPGQTVVTILPDHVDRYASLEL